MWVEFAEYTNDLYHFYLSNNNSWQLFFVPRCDLWITQVAPDRFDNEVFFGYITELIHHWRSFLIYVTDAASNLILWRGSAKVCIPQYLCPLLNSIKIEAISIDNKGINYIRVWAPINSVIAFFWGCVLVENVTLFPSFLLFCVPWLFFGLLKEKSQNPSPWHRPRVRFVNDSAISLCLFRTKYFLKRNNMSLLLLF